MENLKSEKVLTAKELASYFDHTLLRANATVSEFKKLCDDSKRYGFCMVHLDRQLWKISCLRPEMRLRMVRMK